MKDDSSQSKRNVFGLIWRLLSKEILPQPVCLCFYVLKGDSMGDKKWEGIQIKKRQTQLVFRMVNSLALTYVGTFSYQGQILSKINSAEGSNEVIKLGMRSDKKLKVDQ